MPKPDRDRLQRPILLSRIHADRHRGARTQSGEQKIIRRWPGPGASTAFRFVAIQPMWAYRNLLRESTPFTPNDDVRRFNPFTNSAHVHLQTPHREHAFFHTPKL